MKFFKSLASVGFFGFVTLAGGMSLVEAAPMTGLLQAAPEVQALNSPAISDISPDPVHYRRHYHRHYEPSFFRRYYGDWPRYAYPSYRYRLDEYKYFYPPFYW